MSDHIKFLVAVAKQRSKLFTLVGRAVHCYDMRDGMTLHIFGVFDYGTPDKGNWCVHNNTGALWFSTTAIHHIIERPGETRIYLK